MEKICEEIYKEFITETVDENGVLKDISFKNTDRFNYAFDIFDKLGTLCATREALIYLDKKQNEKRFTFGELMKLSNKAANYFLELGIKKGDRVMLVLKRHYQFWISVLALHKIGAVAIPATSQLQTDDFSYRFELGNISAVISTSEDGVPEKIEETKYCCLKVIVNGKKEGWNSFDDEYEKYSDVFLKGEDYPCGDDEMIMFFTSGTTGYPKLAAHSYKYPLGHFVTAKYWHDEKPGEIHFTISDSGWGKALWGKLYGQWFVGSVVFVYDFDRFCPEDILPLFSKYKISTFCAPPTIYRMFIKANPEEYDLSSVSRATTAGEPLNPDVSEKFYEVTGLKIPEGFGQTETSLIIGTLAGQMQKTGSMGKAIPGFRVELLNNDGEKCKTDEIGEIVVSCKEKVPCGVFLGYVNQSGFTNALKKEEYHHTGDLAKMDKDGYFWYVGRKDDIIKSSGYRIGPCEIENVIMELPYVLECAVSGEADEIRGQIVKATVKLVDKNEESDELAKAIQEYVKKKTAPYKYPRKVVFVDELPKTISGKVMRNKL